MIERLSRPRLAALVVSEYVAVITRLRRLPLPQVVAWAAAGGPVTGEPTWRLVRAVDRVLRLGPRPFRCLPRALVLYRLLAAQGRRAHLIVGLPADGAGHKAHAWVELDGVDVGPPPGSAGHSELARY